MADPIQVGTVGLPIRVTLLNDGVAHDPASSTYRELTITRPGKNSENLVKSDSEISIVEDSKGRPCLQYTTVDETDLPSAGPYRVQGFLIDAAGEWPSSVGRFQVLKNIRTPIV